jgi:hypothetical protein
MSLAEVQPRFSEQLTQPLQWPENELRSGRGKQCCAQCSLRHSALASLHQASGVEQMGFIARDVRASWAVDRDRLPNGVRDNGHQLIHRKCCIMGSGGTHGLAQTRDGIRALAIVFDPPADGEQEDAFGVRCRRVSARGDGEMNDLAHEVISDCDRHPSLTENASQWRFANDESRSHSH